MVNSETQRGAERWLPVVGWETLYEVSDRGRVRSLSRMVPNIKGTGMHLYRGRLLTPWKAEYYLKVSLSGGGKVTVRRVHVLVMEAFAGPRPDGMDVLHGPGGKLDNRLENLSYGTPAENMADTRRDGTAPLGERHYKAKLTADIVRQCRARHVAGEEPGPLAAEFGVHPGSMADAIAGRRWGHIPLGERRLRFKLTADIVRQCRARHVAGETITALAAEFRVTPTAMSSAISGRTWRHA